MKAFSATLTSLGVSAHVTINIERKKDPNDLLSVQEHKHLLDCRPARIFSPVFEELPEPYSFLKKYPLVWQNERSNEKARFRFTLTGASTSTVYWKYDHKFDITSELQLDSTLGTASLFYLGDEATLLQMIAPLLPWRDQYDLTLILGNITLKWSQKNKRFAEYSKENGDIPRITYSQVASELIGEWLHSIIAQTRAKVEKEDP